MKGSLKTGGLFDGSEVNADLVNEPYVRAAVWENIEAEQMNSAILYPCQ